MSKKKTKPKKRKEESTYEAKDIYVLEGLEPVRRRPGMYIGSTGPEGLHHLIWECVDNSTSYQTPVIIKNQGKIQVRKIGEIVDKLFEEKASLIEKSINGETEILRKGFEIEALSFDPQTLKLKFQPIFSLIRHKINSEIYKVTLQNGREVEITPYHSLFTLRNGEVSSITGADLKIGTPIVVPRIWPEIESSVREIDLIDELLKLPAEKTESLHLYNVRDLLKKEIYQKLKPFLKEKSEKTFTQHSSNLFYDYRRWDYLPFNLLRRLESKDIKKFKEKTLLGTRYKEKIRLKPKLKISRELIELLGIFAAEGSIVKNKRLFNRIVFSFGAHEKDLIQYICLLVKEVFGIEVNPRYVHETAKTIAIDSYLIALIFKEIIGTGKNSSNKKIPDLIFNSNQKIRERYLIGYLAGDGYPTKLWISHLIQNTNPSGLEKRKFTAVAKNKNFIATLSYLFSSLNKTYSYGERKKKDKKRFISINYKGVNKRREIKSQKTSYALEFYWNTNSSYLNYLPFDEVIERCFDRPTCNQRNNGQLGISQTKILALLEKEKLSLKPDVLKFINSDLGILKVKKIKRIKYTHPWVYDISVPNGENFIGGFSPICLHNSLDEAMAGFCKNIEVSLLPGNKVKTVDDGRGIPVEKHPQTKKSALETVMTTLHAGAKFGGKSYQVAGGLHGVGVSVVCALSEYLRAEVCRGGIKYSQEYARGKAKTKVKKNGKCRQTGTTVIFQPDPQIFSEIKFDLKKILKHLRQQAYLTKKVKITIIDQREKPEKSYSFYFEGGLSSYVKYLTRGVTPRHPNIFYGTGERNGVLIEAAFQYTEEYECFEESFANNINTEEGGTHLTGFRTALTRTFNDYAKKNGFLKESDDNLTGEDVREGFTGVVSVKIKEPQFEGQTKAKLGNPEAKTAVEAVVSETLADFLERNPQDARAIIEKCILSSKARKAAKVARETVLRKGALEGLALPGKLADCTSRKPEESELYIVEGESAGGSGKQARDRRFQAILPLRGKILNVERARLDKILASKEIKSLIIALGTAVAEDFNIDKARYHRIIIMSVDYEEPCFIKDPKGNIHYIKIGQFIDECLDNKTPLSNYQVLCFNKESGKTRFKPIKKIIRHPLREPLYEIQTSYGRKVKVTASHSVFSFKNNKIILQKVSKLKKGDYLVAPISLPLQQSNLAQREIDLLKYLIENKSQLKEKFYWRGEEVANYFKNKLESTQNGSLQGYLGSLRYNQPLSRITNKKFGISNPGFTEGNILVSSIPTLDIIQLPSGGVLTPQHYSHHPLKRYIKVNKQLMNILGWFVAEGDCSLRNGIRFSLGNSDNKFIRELKKDFEDVFGVKVKIYRDKYSKCGQIFSVRNKTLSFIFQNLFGFKNTSASIKKIPDLVFNVTPELQLAFLRGYFLGDGSVGRNHIYVSTTSKELAQQLSYLLSAHGVISSISTRKPDGKIMGYKKGKPVITRGTVYSISIANKKDLLTIYSVWKDHPLAWKLNKKMKNRIGNYNRAYIPIKENLIAIKIKNITRVASSRPFVYDFSVEKDENFIAGLGGICCHNTDADVDGSHIRTLLLTLFYRYFKPIIEKGYLYIAQPPLYKIQTGKQVEYAYGEGDKTEILSSMKKQKATAPSIQRYKGLGEMSASELWETTMNPENRILLKVTIEDAREADKIFDILMGNEVLPRKKFIQTHAKKVKNLDI
jgi:DNA gyrase subunit B